jgi:adenylylsulfate reductase subunit B
MPPIIDKGKCNGCGKCVEICPADVFFGSKKGKMPIISYPDECWHENACVLDCPEGAIKLRIPLMMTVIHK